MEGSILADDGPIAQLPDHRRSAKSGRPLSRGGPRAEQQRPGPGRMGCSPNSRFRT